MYLPSAPTATVAKPIAFAQLLIIPSNFFMSQKLLDLHSHYSFTYFYKNKKREAN